MTQHNPQIALRQILDYAKEAVDMGHGHSVDDFELDRMWCLAMERLVQNIGEASKRVSDTMQQELSHIPWRQIAAFRNRMVHGYDSVDYNRLWLILQNDIPQLITELEKLSLPEFD